MERTWGNLVGLAVVKGGELGGVHGCCEGVVNLCPGDLENGLARDSVDSGSFSGRNKMDETVVDEDALDVVDENE